MRAVAAAWSGNEASLADSRHDRRADSGVPRHRSRTRRASDAASPPARQVTIVLAPYLTWDDIIAHLDARLWRLAEKGALAGVNARSRVREPGQGATPLEGALAVSAGAWALPEWGAPAAYNATETVRRRHGGRCLPAHLRAQHGTRRASPISACR